MSDIDKIIEKEKALREKATGGKWVSDEAEYSIAAAPRPNTSQRGITSVVSGESRTPYGVSARDAALIVHCVNHFPALVEEVERLEGERKRYFDSSAYHHAASQKLHNSNIVLESQLATAQETSRRLNRRCQEYEKGIAEKVGQSPPSMGRALANAAAAMYQAQLEKAKAVIAKAIEDALRSYNLQYQHIDPEGSCVPVKLHDVLTPDGEATIKIGKDELEMLIDEVVAETITAYRAQDSGADIRCRNCKELLPRSSIEQGFLMCDKCSSYDYVQDSKQEGERDG